MSHRVLVIAGMVAMSLFGLVLLVMTLSSSGAWFLFMLMWCAALWWNWSIVLGIPYEIRFDAPGRVSFVALRGTTSLSAAQLHSLKPYGGGVGFYLLRHQGGKIRMIAQITGFHEAIARIKTANPSFEVVGI